MDVYILYILHRLTRGLVSIPTHALPELLLLLVVLVAAAAFSLAVARACAGVGKEEEDVVA